MNEEEFIVKFYSCDDEEQFLKDVYHNLNCLQQENQQLKIQISAREEAYRKLDETNKVLSRELTKDNILKQEHLTTCCGIPIGDIPKLITQQKEFIEWLEAMNRMYQNEYKDIDAAEHYNCVLQKYKSIIGE